MDVKKERRKLNNADKEVDAATKTWQTNGSWQKKLGRVNVRAACARAVATCPVPVPPGQMTTLNKNAKNGHIQAYNLSTDL